MTQGPKRAVSAGGIVSVEAWPIRYAMSLYTNGPRTKLYFENCQELYNPEERGASFDLSAVSTAEFLLIADLKKMIANGSLLAWGFKHGGGGNRLSPEPDWWWDAAIDPYRNTAEAHGLLISGVEIWRNPQSANLAKVKLAQDRMRALPQETPVQWVARVFVVYIKYEDALRRCMEETGCTAPEARLALKDRPEEFRRARGRPKKTQK